MISLILNEAKDVKIGNRDVDRIYRGETLVWERAAGLHLLAHYDFTKQLEDLISGEEPVISYGTFTGDKLGTATRDSDGLHITPYGVAVRLGQWLFHKRIIEIKLGEFVDESENGTYNIRFVMTGTETLAANSASSDRGLLIYRKSPYKYWSSYLRSNTWEDVQLYDNVDLSNKTIRIVIDYPPDNETDYEYSIYIDDEYCGSVIRTASMQDRFYGDKWIYLGARQNTTSSGDARRYGNNLHATIKSVKFYEF